MPRKAKSVKPLLPLVKLIPSASGDGWSIVPAKGRVRELALVRNEAVGRRLVACANAMSALAVTEEPGRSSARRAMAASRTRSAEASPDRPRPHRGDASL